MEAARGRPTRWIGHVDMDSFFASVEIRDDPSLAGRPVVVGGPPEKRGVVAAASYEARKFGVHSAMPMARALQLCPDLVRVSPRGARYKEVSDQVFGILRDFAPALEPLSLDEAFLDLTGSERLLGSPETIGRDIKRRIVDTTGLTGSVGIAPNKFVAKLASDHRKPDGLTIVPHDEAVTFVQALPIGRMWGVGEKTAALMAKHGVVTIGDFAALGPARVKQLFGIGALKMHELAWARDDRPVVPDQDPQQISHEITFARNQSSEDVLRGVLLGLCEQVAGRMRRHRFVGKIVVLKLRFADFKTITRRTTLGHHTADAGELFEEAAALLTEGRAASPLSIRLIGVGMSGLVEPDQLPLSLFDTPVQEARANRLNDALDRLEGRFGKGSVRRARSLLLDDVDRTESTIENKE
jgi:DNA polymerase-4